MPDDLQALEAQLRLKTRYGSAAEVRRAAYQLRLHLELKEDLGDPALAERLEEVNVLIERLERFGFDPLERRVRHWLELLSEISARFAH